MSSLDEVRAFMARDFNKLKAVRRMMKVHEHNHKEPAPQADPPPAQPDMATVLDVLIDAAGIIDHYTSGRPDNWDGSTERQAMVVLRDLRRTIAQIRNVK